MARVLGRIDLVLVPRGTWPYRDPGRVVARRFGATARSVIGDIGVLQQTLLTRAAQAVAAGDADVVLVCGAEAKQRALMAAKTGVAPVDPDPSHTDPDEVLRPVGDILTPTEIERELAVPAHQYAMIESAIAHVERRSPIEQQRHVAELWARFARVAATNPDAWDRRALSADEIGTATAGNRAIAMPYTKLLCSQWNVDQAAAVIVMAQETADALGVARDRRVFARCRGRVQPDGSAPAAGGDPPLAGLRGRGRCARARGPGRGSSVDRRPLQLFPGRRAGSGPLVGPPARAPAHGLGWDDVRRRSAEQLGRPSHGSIRARAARSPRRSRLDHVGQRDDHEARGIVVVGGATAEPVPRHRRHRSRDQPHRRT